MERSFIYCINPESDEPTMLLSGQIGKALSDMPSVDTQEFVNELYDLDKLGKKRIQIHINSVGGNVLMGMDIYNAILKTKTKVDTVNIGVAYSIAGVIFQAGRRRTMMDYSTWMTHDVFNQEDPTKKSEVLSLINESVALMIAGRCGKTKDEVLSMMAKETYLNAEECLKMGLCDEVESVSDSNKPRATANATESWEIANAYMNAKIEIVNNKKPKPMSEVNKILNLNNEANDTARVSAIESIMNKAKELTTQVETLKAENEVLKTSNVALQTEVDTLKTNEATAKAESEKAMKEATRLSNAKAVEAKLKERGVNLDKAGIEKFSNLAGDTAEGLTNALSMIESLPATKTSAVFTGAPESVAPYNMAVQMAKISNNQK